MAGLPRSRPVDPQPFQNTVDDWENRALQDFKPTGGNAPASGPRPDGYSALNYGLFSPPDPQSFMVSSRRRLFNSVTGVALPLNTATAQNNQVILTDTLQQDDGLLIEYLGGQLSISPGASAVVNIRDVSLVIRSGGGNIVLPLASPTLTTLQPNFLDSLSFGPQPLWAARDLNAFLLLQGLASLFTPAQQPLQLQLQISYLSTTAASTLTFQQLYCMYRVVNGLTGA